MKKFYKITFLIILFAIICYGFIKYNGVFKKNILSSSLKIESIKSDSEMAREVVPSDIARLNSSILSFQKKSVFGGDIRIEMGEICKFYTCDQSFSGFELDGIFNISKDLRKIAISNLKASKKTILGKRIAVFSKNEKEKSETSEKIFLAADVFADFSNLDYGVKLLQDILDKDGKILSDMDKLYIEKALSEIVFSVKIQDAILLQKDVI